MNRYPLWRYGVILAALIFGLIYTVPNFYGESPAVQVSSLKATVKIDEQTEQAVVKALQSAGIAHNGILRDANSVKVRFATPDIQIRARDVLEKALNEDPEDPTYITALNLLSSSPQWLTKLGALPMYLGLDLRGGVHFLMQVDTDEALSKRIESTTGELRGLLRDRNIRHAGIRRAGNAVEISFRDEDTRQRAEDVLRQTQPDLALAEQGSGADLKLVATMTENAMRAFLDSSLQQNITTLNNRINELGVAEPVIQRQGLDRVVVQLPGVQDTARAKDILGRTATLEARLVDLSSEA